MTGIHIFDQIYNNIVFFAQNGYWLAHSLF